MSKRTFITTTDATVPVRLSRHEIKCIVDTLASAIEGSITPPSVRGSIPEILAAWKQQRETFVADNLAEEKTRRYRSGPKYYEVLRAELDGNAALIEKLLAADPVTGDASENERIALEKMQTARRLISEAYDIAPDVARREGCRVDEARRIGGRTP